MTPEERVSVLQDLLERVRRRAAEPRYEGNGAHSVAADEYLQASAYEQPGYAEPEYAPPEYAEPEYAQPEYAEPEYAEPEYAQPEYAEPEYAEPEYAEPEYAQPEYAEPEYAEPEYAQPEYAEPEYAQPEYAAHQGSPEFEMPVAPWAAMQAEPGDAPPSDQAYPSGDLAAEGLAQAVLAAANEVTQMADDESPPPPLVTDRPAPRPLVRFDFDDEITSTGNADEIEALALAEAALARESQHPGEPSTLPPAPKTLPPGAETHAIHLEDLDSLGAPPLSAAPRVDDLPPLPPPPAFVPAPDFSAEVGAFPAPPPLYQPPLQQPPLYQSSSYVAPSPTALQSEPPGEEIELDESDLLAGSVPPAQPETVARGTVPPLHSPLPEASFADEAPPSTDPPKTLMTSVDQVERAAMAAEFSGPDSLSHQSTRDFSPLPAPPLQPRLNLRPPNAEDPNLPRPSGGTEPPPPLEEPAALEEAPVSSQRQLRDLDRAVDDHLDGASPSVEPPPESGEIESQRRPSVQAGGAEGFDDAPTPRPRPEPTAEVRSLGSVDVLDRQPASAAESPAVFEGIPPVALRSFGQIVDEALDLGGSP